MPRRQLTRNARNRPRKVLVVDVGGTHVKVLATGKRTPRKLWSGPSMTAAGMVEAVQRLAADWSYDVVSLGYPGAVRHGRPVAEPRNLGNGWVGFDFEKAFGCPVKVINDAAMQALGSYEGGRVLFLGFGTGLGSALISDGVLVPMELAHLRYRKGRTYEDFVGLRGLKRYGAKKWRRYVADVVTALRDALQADYVVLGGGNSRRLKRLPDGARLGVNTHAFSGGFRLWEDAWNDDRPTCIVQRGYAEAERPGLGPRLHDSSQGRARKDELSPVSCSSDGEIGRGYADLRSDMSVTRGSSPSGTATRKLTSKYEQMNERK